MFRVFLITLLLSLASSASASELLRAKLANSLSSLGVSDWEEEEGDRLVAVTGPGDAGESCHPCHFRQRGGCSSSMRSSVAGATCQQPSACDSQNGNKIGGHCNGGSDNVCCKTNDNNNNNNNNSEDNSEDNSDPAPAPGPNGYNVPPLQTSGSPGSPGASCKQGYSAGKCIARSQCGNGYKVQTGLCGGSEVCCLPQNAGGGNDILPASLSNSCFPLQKSGFTYTSGDYGNGRPRSSSSRRNKRCHSGQDIFSKDPGRIVAIADGVVTGKTDCFLKCRSGWGIRKFYRGVSTCAGALYVYHESLGVTVNYGESDSVNYRRPNVGSRVSKGQVIGRASACGMVHVEFYKGKRSSNTRWWGSRDCLNAANRGKTYQCRTPNNAAENNYCAKYAYDIKPTVNLDPRPWLLALSGKWC